MDTGSFRFGPFLLDAGDRQLRRDGAPVELNARYLDALALLVSEGGRLVSKDRFLAEVWRGVPVTDEALTQCIKTLRRQLGDNAASPIFIETVPKHGYRFIAPVEMVGEEPSPEGAEAVSANGAPASAWRRFALLGAAGTTGAGVAGVFGGLFYGFAGASGSGTGAASALVVITCLTIVVALLGGAGVSFGIAATGFGTQRLTAWSIAGGSVGGLVVGALVKLLGLDAFDLLLGQAPRDITGPGEGAILGAAVGLGAWLAGRRQGRWALRLGSGMAALTGAGAGLAIALAGGRLLGGSLDLLTHSFAGARLRLDGIGTLFGEQGLGPVSRAMTSALEGALFAGCVVAAMLIARRRSGSGR